jgi:predicted dehydrogenase
MAKLRWGILSTGRIADWFCGDFHRVKDAELAAVCSRTQSAADAFAKKHKIANAYSAYEEMLVGPAIDAIYIGTPHTLHFENTKAALQAGKAVLCEKPITVDAQECWDLIDIATGANAYLMEAMWTYFLPAMRKAKEWCETGRIGDLLHIKTDFGYPIPFDPKQREYDADLGGGCLLEMGVYPIAIASYFADGEPTLIEAVGSKAPNGVEDDVTAIFKFGDVTATIGASYRARLRNAAHIIGTDGYIVIPDAFRCQSCFLYRIDECIDRFEATRQTRGYEYQAISMCSDLLRGETQSSLVPLSKSLLFQNAIDAVKARIGVGKHP